VATFEEPPGPGSIRVVAAEGTDDEPGGTVPLARGVAVELILDTSGSMLEEVEPGQTRIDAAKEVLTALVTDTLPRDTPLVLRAFGTRPGSCGTRRVVRLAPLDPEAVAQTIAGVEAYDEVKTPLAAALAEVADDLADATGPKIVVLVTDGEETCGGDPAAAIQALVDRGIEVHVNIVGFALADEELKAEFERWARLGNGQYIDAADAEELDAAVERAVAPPYRVLDDTGDVVATGVVDGDPVAVPAGVYTVEVLTDPPQVFHDVAVEAEEGVVVTLAAET